MPCERHPSAGPVGRWATLWAVLGCLALGLPAVAQAEDKAVPVEALLPGDAKVYVRFDGLDAHRTAFSQTAFGQLATGDLKPLLDFTNDEVIDALGPGALSELLLEGVRPEQLLELQQGTDAFFRLLARVKDRGFAATFELINPLKPRLQLTLVFPNVKDDADRSTIVDTFRLLAALNEAEVETVELQGRKVLQFKIEGVLAALWSEGQHMVATLGTEKPDHALAVMNGERPNLAQSELLKLGQQPVPYASCLRGFIHTQGIMEIINEAFPPAQLVFPALGLHELESIAFQAGFDGPFQRMTTWMTMPGQRRGLLKLLTTAQPISFDELPALPPQPTLVYATRLEWKQLYDDAIAATKSILQVALPFGAPDVDQALKDINRTLGFDLRNDLLDSLGEQLVMYDAADQGPFMFGTALAIEVRDEARLRTVLEKLTTLANAEMGDRFERKDIEYRGAPITIWSLRSAANETFFRPTYTIHRGWLVFSLLPQSVQGFVYRNGDQPARRWQPPQVLQRLLGEGKGDRLVAVSVTDARPAIEQLLSSLPLIIDLERQISGRGQVTFDSTLLPPVQAINDLMEPAVSATFDDGRTVRTEWQSIVPFPVVTTGFNTQLLLLLGLTSGF